MRNLRQFLISHSLTHILRIRILSLKIFSLLLIAHASASVRGVWLLHKVIHAGCSTELDSIFTTTVYWGIRFWRILLSLQTRNQTHFVWYLVR